jgi:CRP-like cAMP-binding protein
LLDDLPRSADAVAAEPSVLLVLEREPFRQFLMDQPTVPIRLLATMTRYIRSNTELIQDATFLDVPARVARVLLELATPSGETGLPAEGTALPERLKQSEIASLVGATRESVNKCLASFEKQGLIRNDKRQITLLRPSALKQRIY